MHRQEETPGKQFENYINKFIDEKNEIDELEIVFGGGNLTRIDFENVIKKLKSLGFYCTTPAGIYHLNIQNHFTDVETGRTKISAIRTTISGIDAIQKYCNDNTINPESPFVTFMQKFQKRDNTTPMRPIRFNDFGFNVNYKEEKKLPKHFRNIVSLVGEWGRSKKIFRLLKRFTFANRYFPVMIDCSIVRSSRRRGNYLEPESNIKRSGVFSNPETYEIEIELNPLSIPTIVKPEDDKIIKMDVLTKVRQTIKFVLSGIQETNYPISCKEQGNIINEYMSVLNKKSLGGRVTNRDFVGPSSISLERANIVPIDPDATVANIRTSYTITEKADGIRKLLFVSRNGNIYLIDVNMRVQFTGCKSKNKDVYNTIIDGEHVLHDKKGEFINQYLAFDLYYLDKQDIRHHPFIVEGETQSGRLILLKKCIGVLDIDCASNQALKIKAKDFLYSDTENNAIFTNCKTILDRMKSGWFDYNTDGIIFTPAEKGVGSDKNGEHIQPSKKTWKHSLKWKPASHNSIDFLVTTVKTETGVDVIKTIFEKGNNVLSDTNLTQYKTLQLRVGFDEYRDGYLNPCEDVIQGKIPKKLHKPDYKPVPFYPSNPTPTFPAYLCNVVVENNGMGNEMSIEDGSAIIEDKTIVEFRYDQTRDKFWQWIPIKVRVDKTTDYRNGGSNYGNAYHVAQSVWNSIHNPITEEMLSTGLGIPGLIADEDVYYNKKETATTTRSLRDFHNLYVKRALIMAASKYNGTLIDMSVGKAGDLSKWMAAKLSFVFGLDLARDNIENRMNGACARFLNKQKDYNKIPDALFVNANSALNIRSGDACFTEMGKRITRSIFGDGPKDEKKLGKGVYKQHGVGKDGFDVVSNQFSIHYFAESPEKFHNFLRNVSECCKVGGYFIGTSYDGKAVFDHLEKKEVGESMIIATSAGERIWEITKQYEATTFNNDASSLGYRIDVYQESINKTFPEYLVNYDYLISTIENYGFQKVEKDELIAMDLPSSVGGFEQLYSQMSSQIKSKKIRANDVGTAPRMSRHEKEISYLNRYFIFKKVREVQVESMSKILIRESPQYGEEKKQSIDIVSEQSMKPKIIKKRKKLKIKAPVVPPILQISEKMEEPTISPSPGNVVKISKKKRKAKIIIEKEDVPIVSLDKHTALD
tara:strand:+ start:14706 stop:18158 length:3453 start_codon:yes stop_codon:yes gene_type:complete